MYTRFGASGELRQPHEHVDTNHARSSITTISDRSG
jgi:hypothetical protein